MGVGVGVGEIVATTFFISAVLGWPNIRCKRIHPILHMSHQGPMCPV